MSSIRPQIALLVLLLLSGWSGNAIEVRVGGRLVSASSSQLGMVEPVEWNVTNAVSSSTNPVEVVAAMAAWLDDIHVFRLPMNLSEFPTNHILSFSELYEFLGRRGISIHEANTVDYRGGAGRVMSPDSSSGWRGFFESIDRRINPRPVITHYPQYFRRVDPDPPPTPSVEFRNFSFTFRSSKRSTPVPSEEGRPTGYVPARDVIEEMQKFPVFFRNPSTNEVLLIPRNSQMEEVEMDKPWTRREGLSRLQANRSGALFKAIRDSPIVILDYEPNILGAINSRVFDLANFPTANLQDISGPVVPNGLYVPIAVQGAVHKVFLELLVSLEQTNAQWSDAIRQMRLASSISTVDERNQWSRQWPESLHGILFFKTKIPDKQILVSTFLLRAAFFQILQHHPPPGGRRTPLIDDDLLLEKLFDHVKSNPQWATEVYQLYLEALHFPLAHEMAHVYLASAGIPATCPEADKAAVNHLKRAYGKASLGAFESLLVKVVIGGAPDKWGLTLEQVQGLKKRYEELQTQLHTP